MAAGGGGESQRILHHRLVVSPNFRLAAAGRILRLVVSNQVDIATARCANAALAQRRLPWPRGCRAARGATLWMRRRVQGAPPLPVRARCTRCYPQKNGSFVMDWPCWVVNNVKPTLSHTSTIPLSLRLTVLPSRRHTSTQAQTRRSSPRAELREHLVLVCTWTLHGHGACCSTERNLPASHRRHLRWRRRV